MTKQRALKWLEYAIFVILASLDNAAAGVLPPLYAIISRDLGASEASLGLVTAVYVIIAAVSAILWGYWGDSQQSRKPLLLIGTAVWSGSMILTGRSDTLTEFLIFQSLTAVGVGAVSSIGFSMVSDIVPAGRRGFALSIWSISQGLGAAFGALLAGIVGAFSWPSPFFIIAGLGIFFSLIYLFISEPLRGQAEPELKSLFDVGKVYESRIHRSDIFTIWQQHSTRWLLWESFFFSFAFGSSVWIPRWAIARVQAEGFDLETATIIGNIIVLLFSVGSLSAIFFGHLGDALERRAPRKRPLLAMFGLLTSVPFFIVLFFLPLTGIAPPPQNGLNQLLVWILNSFLGNPWLMTAFLVALIGQGLLATGLPNWAAMMTNLNLPEHRGTAIGMSRLFRAGGTGLSIAAAGFLFQWLQLHFSETDSFAIGLALFQLIVIVAAGCYWLVQKTIVSDSQHISSILKKRASFNNKV